MEELVEYTMNNLYGLVKPYGKFEAEELCYVVEVDYDCIDNELSYTTDNLSQALSKAKENDDKIFIYTKKFAKDCLNTHKIFEDTLENLEEEGLDIGFVIGGIEEYAEEKFTELINIWFKKYVGNDYWFPDRLLGTLKTGD
jgi:hypothetical protein